MNYARRSPRDDEAQGDAGATHLDLDAWRKIIDVNLTGMFLCCKHVLPQMREQASGSIINISSLASIAATGMLAYKVSKAGSTRLPSRSPWGTRAMGSVAMPFSRD